jgi:hypothetical protein
MEEQLIRVRRKSGKSSTRCKFCKNVLHQMTRRNFAIRQKEQFDFELEVEVRKEDVKARHLESMRLDNSMPYNSSGNPRTSRVDVRYKPEEDHVQCDCPYWGTEFS